MKWIHVTLPALAAGLQLIAQPPIPDFAPETPLIRAALKDDTAGIKKLLDEGADPNQGRFLSFTPVFLPIMNQNLEAFRAMAAKGADVKATDHTGSTTLMWAVANEYGQTEIAEELIRMGVDPLARNQKGETAMDWALRRGVTPAVAVLERAGARQTARVRESVELALSLLQKSSTQFLRVSGCASCHHQSQPQMVASLARERGWAVNEQTAKQQTGAVAMMIQLAAGMVEKKPESLPDPPIVVGYYLIGLHAEGYPANASTAAMVRLLEAQQLPDGGFHGMPARPPQEASRFTATALAMRAMQLYGGAAQSQAIARAAAWLEQNRPCTNEDHAMRLMGLAWAKPESNELGVAVKELLAAQRPDGGWGQNSTLETDAYATGQSLVALRESGMVSVQGEAYLRGVGFLLRTQLPDGSWHVRTRSFPVQPYKESGFPHGKDQWISASGTAWAAMALAYTVEPVRREETSGQ